MTSARDISDRRIAYLKGRGEDARNTVAWRDAMYERHLVEFGERSSHRSSKARERLPRHRDNKVVIRWFALSNPNARAGGFVPAIETNGKLSYEWRGDRGGFSQGEAELMAEARAREAADRYTGDWRISVRKGSGRYISAAVTRDAKRWKR